MKQGNHSTKSELQLEPKRDVNEDHTQRHQETDAALIRQFLPHRWAHEFCPPEIQINACNALHILK